MREQAPPEGRAREGRPLSSANSSERIVYGSIDKIGPYTVVGNLGAGGTSQVLAATGPEGQVAVKVFNKINQSKEDVDREVAAHNVASRLVPNVPTLYGTDRDHINNDPTTPKFSYMVMSRAGGSLRRVLNIARLSADRAVAHVFQVSSDLEIVHEKADLVHGDVKTGNVLYAPEGEILWLSDWGVASSSGELGNGYTPHHGAPEQVFGESLSPAADQFGMAGMVYEMVTGRLPFAAVTAETYDDLVTSDDYPTSLVRATVSLPPELQGPVRKAMRQRPGDRYDSVLVFAQELVDRRKEAKEDAARRRKAIPGSRDRIPLPYHEADTAAA